MRKNILVFLFLILSLLVSAQNRYRVDSLSRSLKGQMNDSILFSTYNELALEFQNDSVKAFGFAKQVSSIADKNKDLRWQCKAFMLYAKLFIVLHNFKEAKKSLAEGLKLANASKYEIGVGYYQAMEGALMSVADDFNDSTYRITENHYTKAINIFSKYELEADLARTYNNFAAYFYNSSRVDTTLKLLLVALRHGKKSGNLQVQANTYNFLKFVYDFKNDHENSFQVSLKYFELLEAMRDTARFGFANVYIARTLLDIKNYDEATKYLEKAIAYGKQEKNNDLLASCYTNYAILQMEKKNYNKSIALNRTALEYQYKSGSLKRLPLILGNMGESFLGLKMLDSALSCQTRALDLRLKQNNYEGVMFSYKSFAEIYNEKNDFKKALEYAQKAIRISYKYDIHSYDIDIYSALYPAAKGLGNYQLAFCYLDTLKKLNDSINNAEGSMHINDLKANYENEKLEKERELTDKLKDERQKAEVDRQKYFRKFIVMVLGLMSIFSFVVLRNYRQKKKANVILAEQKAAVQDQKELVEEKNKEILDSIHYAQKIQSAILPTPDDFSKIIPESFILFRPKDIVSGDFYWITEKENFTFYAAADCTGHGVPGGFMSMLGTALLNEVVNEKNSYEPADILDILRVKIIIALKQKGVTGENQDGMDMCLVRINKEKDQLVFAAANNSMYLVRNKVITEHKGDKQPVGISGTEIKQFSQKTISLQKDDHIYAFTDGYADQFGGPRGKKFKYKQLEELLTENSALPMTQQKNILETKFLEWKGHFEQVDDVCIIGIKI